MLKMECLFYAIGSSYIFDVQESIERLGWKVRAYIANQNGGKLPTGLSPIVEKAKIEHDWLELPVVFPLISPGFRRKLEIEATGFGFRKFASVIDPTAVIASRSSFQSGALVNCGALVGSNTHAGRFAVLNRGASLGHNVVLEDFVTLGPAATVCGSCRIGKGVFIGAGAIVNPEVTIGMNSIIGSGSVVVRDVPERSLIVGNPGRIVKEGIAGYNGTSV